MSSCEKGTRSGFACLPLGQLAPLMRVLCDAGSCVLQRACASSKTLPQQPLKRSRG